MDNTSRKKLHNLLVSENLYSKSYDEFEKQFSNPESQKKLHGLLVEEDLYSKPEADFYTQFFSDVKKKNPSQPTKEVTSVSGKSALPLANQKKVSTSKSPTQGESQGLLLLDPSKKESKFDYTNPAFYAPKESVAKDINYIGKSLGSKSKDLSIKQSDLKKQADLLSKQYDDLNAYIELNPNDPSITAKVAALEKQKALLNKESETVNKDVIQLNQDAKGLNKLVTQNYAEKAKQGNWGGALWNSVVTGFEKYGQGMQRATIDAGIELLDLMGLPYASKEKESELRNKVVKESKGKLTEDQIKSKVKDLSKKEVIAEFKPILKKGYEGIKSEGTTEEFIQEKKKSGMIPEAVLGIAESVPMMASGGYGRFATGTMQMYANLNEEMDNNPETASMDENERKKITLPIAIVSGFLEDFGFRNVLGKGTPLLSKFTNMVLAEVPKNATLKSIELATKKLAESAVGKMLLKGGTTAAKGYLSEFETGGLQSFTETVTKEIYDKANNINLFENPKLLSGEFLDKVLYDAHVEGLGGLIMTGTIAGAQRALSGKQMSDAEFEEWRDLMLDDSHIEATLANLQIQFFDGKITYEQFSEPAKELANSRKILQQIPDNLSPKGQREAFGLIAQNQKIQNEIDDLSAYMADKNPQLVKNIAAEIESKQAIINKNNEQLSKIPENAIQEQTTSEVPVQPEAGVSGEVAEGEPKAEPQGVTEEVKAEEIGDNVEDVTSKLERLSTDNKMQYIGNDMPIMGNESLIAEQYLQAKQDGSNPELVATVESLINKDAAEKMKQVEDAFAGITRESVQNQTPAEEVKAEEVVTPTEEVKVEEVTPIEPITPEQKAEQVTAVKKGIDAVNKAVDRGRPLKKAVEGGIAFMQKTIAYEQADDVTREQMVRDINKKFGIKEKKAPSVNKVLNKPTAKKVTLKELTALNSLYKAESKGAKGGVKASQETIAQAIAEIKAMQQGNRLTQAQANVLLNGLKSNLMNPNIREKYFERVKRVLDNAEYAAKLQQANKLVGKIRKSLKSSKVVDDVKNAVKSFLAVKPNLVENIDEYLDYAEQIADAIKPVTVSNGIVSPKRAVVIADINEYAKTQKDIQDNINKNILLDQYQYLVDANLISDKMSLSDMQKYISAIQEDPKKAEASKSDIVKEYAKNAFEGFSEVVRDMIDNGELEGLDIDLINKFLDMDIEALGVAEQLAAVNALDNLVVNGITTQMGAVYQSYDGAVKSEADLESGMVAQPLIYGLVGRIPLGVGKIYSSYWGRLISKPESLVINIFRSTSKGIRFLKNSGFSGIVRGFVQGKKIANNFAESYSNKYKNQEPNNQDFYTAYNAYERGIYADLSRTISNGTPQEIQQEFDRKMDQLDLTIKELEKIGDNISTKKAELYNEVYQKIKDKKNIEEVSEQIDPINREAVKDFQNEWKKYYAEFKRMAADYYGIILDEDVNYTPEMYERLATETTVDLLTKGSFKMNFDAIKTERVGTLQKINRIEGLPMENNEVTRVRDYDFDSGNIRALERTLIDVKTTPYVQQYLGYVNSDAFKKMIPEYNQRQMIKDRLAFNIDGLRGRSNTSSLYETEAAAKFLSHISRIGTKIGLGSLNAAVKQSLPMVTNTYFNTIDSPGAFLNSFVDYSNPDAMKALDESGYGISLRGIESQTSIDFAENLIKRSKNKNINAVLDGVGKISDAYIENFLKKPDVFVAKLSWFAYYRKKLKDLGLSTQIDWANHKINKEAGDYAEYMVQDQQNMNISELGGKLLASKDPTTKIIRQLLFPFASYSFNLKDRNARNLTILTSKNANDLDKAIAFQSLSSGLAESAVFESVNRYVIGLLSAAAYLALGGDDRDEEDKLLDEQFKDKIFYGKLVNEFAVNLPDFMSEGVLLSLNGLFDLFQGGTPEEQLKAKKEAEKEAEKEAKENAESLLGRKVTKKRGPRKTLAEKESAKKKERLETPFRFFVKDPKEGEAFMSLVGGVPNVAYETLSKIYDTYKDANNGYFVDKYGNKTEYTEEQKKQLKLSLIPRLFTASTLAPREALTFGNNIEKIIKKQALMNKKKAKEEEAINKSKKRFKY